MTRRFKVVFKGRIKFIGLLIVTIFWAISANAQDLTPSHVYFVSEEIVREIRILREAVGADDYPVDPEPQTLKRPAQVYGKGVELMYKVSYAQTKFGLPPATYETIPPKNITPSDVHELATRILAEVRQIKTYLAVPTPIEEVEFVDGKVPSNVYENLWRASYLMDYLSGAIKPTDVFRYSEQMIAEINILATAYKINLADLNVPDIKEGIRPKDVAAQGVQNLHKLIRIEKKMGYQASIVPTMTLSRATPSDVFDIIGMLMAELAFIKAEAGIIEIAGQPPEVSDKTPAHVLQRLEYAGSTLDRLLAGVRRP